MARLAVNGGEKIRTELIRPSLSRGDLDDVANAFFKVWECRDEL